MLVHGIVAVEGEMRVGLTSIVFSKRGGIGRLVAELAEHLVGGNEVHLLTARYVYHVEGLTVHENSILWKPISLQVLSNAVANQRVVNKLRGEGVLVNSHGAEAFDADVVTQASCQRAVVRKFGVERGLSYSILKGLEPRNNVVLAIERRVVNRSRRVIAISESVKDELVQNYGISKEKVEVVYCGVNLDEFNLGNRGLYRDEIRRGLGFSPDDIVLMFAGWEFKRKGLRYIIEALPLLRKSVRLLVFGGADERDYDALASKLGVRYRVVFADPQARINRFYAAADLFVFPTSYEPFGLVITEAMASGLPVVTSRIAGAAELISDGRDGMLLDSPYDAREVAEKVDYILDNNLVGRMGAEARRTAEKYPWSRTAREVMKVYGGI